MANLHLPTTPLPMLRLVWVQPNVIAVCHVCGREIPGKDSDAAVDQLGWHLQMTHGLERMDTA